MDAFVDMKPERPVSAGSDKAVWPRKFLLFILGN
jgi:hypothetical protein